MEQEPKKKRGRPATGQTPKRNVRIGRVWDDGEELAAAYEMTMTAYVEEALRHYNALTARRLRHDLERIATDAIERDQKS